jgi:hypothetical protein
MVREQRRDQMCRRRNRRQRGKVTLDIAAEIPTGAPDQVVRTITENSRTLKFKSSGFETE